MKVSVVLTVYNKPAEYIRAAIDAILNQTFRDFELIIINNGSTMSECEETILEFDDERIIYIKNEKNIAFADTKEFEDYYRSFFLRGSGEYVMWAHDDDIMEKHMLEKEVAVLDSNKDVGAVATDVNFIDKEGNDLEGNKVLDQDVLYNQYEFINSYFKEKTSIISTPTMLFRRSKIKQALDIISERNCKFSAAVFDLMYKISINLVPCKIYILAEKLYNYRYHEGETSVSGFYNSRYENYEKCELPRFLEEECNKGFIDVDAMYECFRQRGIRDSRKNFEIEINTKIGNLYGFECELMSIRSDKTRKIWEDKIPYLTVKRSLLKAKCLFESQKKEYVFWGAGDNEAARLFVECLVPEIKCVGYIDSFKRGHKDNLPIFSPEDYDFSNDKYIIVIATSAEKEISAILKEKGLKELEDYLPQLLL